MKEKVIDLIKAKHPKLTIPKKILEAAAAKILAKCGDDETLIEAQIEIYEEYNPIADQVKKDSQLATAIAKASGNTQKTEGTTTETPEGTEGAKPDETATLLKSIMAEIAGLKAEKIQGTIREKVSASLKEKNVDNEYWSEWALPEKEEDILAFVEKVDTKYSAFTQGLADRGILSTTPPKIGAGGTPVKTTAPTKEELENVSKQIGI